MKTWITADWHLGEDRFDMMGRPFTTSDEHIQTLIDNHNALVDPDDKVIMVGDVCYQKTPEKIGHVWAFNGKKTLIRGNHDRVFTDKQLEPYFENIFAECDGYYVEFQGVKCYITHYPCLGREDAFNLVGHIHGAWKYQLNMLNIGVDVHHFRPVCVDTVPFHFTAVDKYYDQNVWVAYDPINANYRGKRGKAGSYFTPEA